MNKKGFVKIIEAVIAIIIIFIFMFTILPQGNKVEKVPENIKLFQEKILDEIESNETLRQEVLEYPVSVSTLQIISYRNNINIDKFIKNNLYPTLEYNYTVCTDNNEVLICNPDFLNLPTEYENMKLPTNKAVYAKSRIIANSTQTNTFKLYVWENF
ncbi:MAG: hypothetical protein PHF86_11310 [Candidatus Nanoarchaeia archaeon]|nr:hypothetical protein [Candidatus Nanoarchaeia archaeon]